MRPRRRRRPPAAGRREEVAGDSLKCVGEHQVGLFADGSRPAAGSRREDEGRGGAGGGAMSGRRRDVRAATRCGQRAARRTARSARSENRSAGAPIGGGTDSSQATGAPRYPNDPRPARGCTRAGAAVVRRSPEDRFSARQAEASPPGCRADAAARREEDGERGSPEGLRYGAALRIPSAHRSSRRTSAEHTAVIAFSHAFIGGVVPQRSPAGVRRHLQGCRTQPAGRRAAHRRRRRHRRPSRRTRLAGGRAAHRLLAVCARRWAGGGERDGGAGVVFARRAPLRDPRTAAPGTVRATLADRDRIENDDWIQIYLGTFNDGRQATGLRRQPARRADGRRHRRGDRRRHGRAFGGITGGRTPTDISPDFVFESKGRLTATGYEVESPHPVQEPALPVGASQDWGLHVVRRVQTPDMKTRGCRRSRSAASFLGQSGTLIGLTGLQRGLVMDLNPSLVARAEGRTRGRRLDLRWRGGRMSAATSAGGSRRT